ncbi:MULTISPECIES: hypothetical protein [unclassified Luteococcus]|uniref:hypothetical protein n=1 Tax=unclassified Luteococcus TaxID=2639923 RepID=UPI00313DB28A
MTSTPQTARPATRRGWFPVLALVLAILLGLGLPWAHLMGTMAPLAIAVMVTVLGVAGSLVAAKQQRTVLFIANAVVAFGLVPLMLGLVTLLAGP